MIQKGASQLLAPLPLIKAIEAVLLVVVILFAPPARTQTASDAASLSVTGKVARRLVLRETELAQLPQHHLEVTDEKGQRVTYDGVWITEILDRAGVPLGTRLRGPRMKLYVVVKGADGYSVVFALAEFDPDYGNRNALLADRRDGHRIAPTEGPFRLVVPGEKFHARWVRAVTTIEVDEAK